MKAHLQECEENPIGWTAQANLEAILEDHGIPTAGVHRAVLARRTSSVSLCAYLPAAPAAGLDREVPPAVEDEYIYDVVEDGDVESNPGPSCTLHRRAPSVSSRIGYPDAPAAGLNIDVPPAVEDEYIHDVVEDGDIESNPGPSCTLSCLSWNCQGKAKLYEAFHLGVFDGYDIVCLQETNFWEEDRCDFSKLALQRGFHSYHGGGHQGVDTRGRGFARGGLTTLVKHGRASRLLRAEWNEGQYEWLGVQMEGFALHNVHRKPGGDEELYTTEVQELMGDYSKAILVGDHNIQLGDF